MTTAAPCLEALGSAEEKTAGQHVSEQTQPHEFQEGSL